MPRTVFLAGAAGAIGRRLTPMLVARGWRVVGTTRSSSRSTVIRELGGEPIIVDAYDEFALAAAVRDTAPDVVMHQLTDLPPGLDPARMEAALHANARLRVVGTHNLVAAAIAAGTPRLIAQSVAFAYVRAATPHDETAPLAVDAEGPAGISARGVARLESQVLDAQLDGLVLRYGRLYGPGTGFDAPARPAPLHVDDAARAAVLAAERGSPGVYNIAEDDGFVTSAKAERELGWAAAGRH